MLSLVHPIPHLLFPESPGPQIALGIVLGIATCLSFFVLLRMLGLRTLPATLISCLALVFPWADSIRLWPIATVITIALLFFFLGVIAALAGLARGAEAVSRSTRPRLCVTSLQCSRIRWRAWWCRS